MTASDPACEPQVEIEAQIIETDHDRARARNSVLQRPRQSELGNTTGLAFPNSARSAADRHPAGANVATGDPRSTLLERTGSAVNLPATGASSAVGLTLGALNGAFNLDVA